MTSTVVFWALAAILLFWGIGAYNRLVRLRAEAKAAFALLDAELTRDVELVRHQLPQADTQASGVENDHSVWAGLRGAAEQFAASLAAARNRPLNAEGIAALGAARDVMAMAWERAERSDAHDLGGPHLAATVLARRSQILAQANAAADQFNRAVARYNAAIAEFPAVLLASFFGFRPGRGIDLPDVDA
ncbi:MAG: LemA family protein [Pseudomonadota bacterium]